MLDTVIYTVGILLIVVSAAFIWLTKPYMSYETTRSTNEIVTITAEYVNDTGEPLCSKLYEIAGGVTSGKAIIPNMPKDVPDPHDWAALEDGDFLTIYGYRYQWKARNIITGGVETRPVGMVDVVAWEGPHNLLFKSELPDAPANQFNRRNYTDCR